MNYTTGQVASWVDLRSAIISELVTNHGWTMSSGTILNKGVAFLTLTVSSLVTSAQGPGIILQGGTGIFEGSLVNPSGVTPRMGRGTDLASEPSWPATYHLFAFENPDEVYCILNFDGNRHLFCAFGVSSIVLPGSGLWMTASAHKRLCTTSSWPARKQWVITSSAGGYNYNAEGRWSSGGPFWETVRPIGALDSMADTIHHGFDGSNWAEGRIEAYNSGYTAALIDQGALHVLPAVYSHISRSPSAWNQESPLLPIKGYVQRPSGKCSLSFDLANARYVRVDNYTDGEIITLGSEKWKVFPFHLKSLVERNGSTSMSPAASIDHTGTFGWAIRYDGP